MPDLQLRQGLQYLLETCPWMREYWRVAKCPIEWGTIVGMAQYSGKEKKITVADRYRWDWKDVLAALIAHELVHSVWEKRCEIMGISQTRDIKMLEEYDAYLITRRAWGELALNRGRPDGTNAELDSIERMFDNETIVEHIRREIARRWGDA